MGRDERVSINSFEVGGSNAHVVVESAANFFASRDAAAPKKQTTNDEPHLLLFSANTTQSLKDMVQNYQSLLSQASMNLADVAYTLGNRREHLLRRSFATATKDKLNWTPLCPLGKAARQHYPLSWSSPVRERPGLEWGVNCCSPTALSLARSSCLISICTALGLSHQVGPWRRNF